jgi:hypothetical protein
MQSLVRNFTDCLPQLRISVFSTLQKFWQCGLHHVLPIRLAGCFYLDDNSLKYLSTGYGRCFLSPSNARIR